MSVFYDLLDAIKTRLDDLGTLPTVRIRKRLNASIQDTKPHVLVVPGKEEVVEYTFVTPSDAKVVMDYEVWVLYVASGDGELDEDTEVHLDARQTIRRLLFVINLVTGHYDPSLDLHPPFDHAAMNVGLDYSPVRFKYRVAEERSR
jgi:hypothetical protein